MDNETLAAYIHHVKTADDQCVFDNDTAKGLWDAHTTRAEVYEKDPKTLSEVIRIVEKLNVAQQLTATLTPSIVIMMSNDDRCFVDVQVILAATGPMHSVTAVMNLATLHKTFPTRFLCQEHHTTKKGLIQYHNTPTCKKTDHTALTMGTDMGDISTNHNHAAVLL